MAELSVEIPTRYRNASAREISFGDWDRRAEFTLENPGTVGIRFGQETLYVSLGDLEKVVRAFQEFAK